MKVVLINPNIKKPPLMPLALDYLAGPLREAGFDLDLIDLGLTDPKKWREDTTAYFDSSKPDAICITMRNTEGSVWPNSEFYVPKLKKLVDLIRQMCDAPIIVGGAGFSVMPEYVLRYCNLAYGVIGEGEGSLPMLLLALKEGRAPLDVPNLIYLEGDEYVRTPLVAVDIREMSPSRDFINNKEYFDNGGMVGVETKRGCNQSCVYCVEPSIKGRQAKKRMRSPKSVADELEKLLEQGATHIYFTDSEFNLPADHAKEVCKEIIRRGLEKKIKWYAYVNIVPFDEELADLMKKSACDGICFGVESGNDNVLKNLGKNFTLADIEQTIKILKKHKIPHMIDLMFGGPGETKATVRETIELMKKLEPDVVGVGVGIRIFPKTPLSKIVKEEGFNRDNENLHGSISGNRGFYEPVYYITGELSETEDPFGYVRSLIGGDERFIVYLDYTDLKELEKLIAGGARGAFWRILQKNGGN